MQTLYIHIGYHKTGTTSLQSVLGLHRQELLQMGVCYPQTKGEGEREYFNKHLAFYAALAQAQKSGGSLTAPVDRMSEEIFASGAPVAVISEESFSGFDRRMLDALVRFRLHFEVKIIAVLRRQDKFLQSFYQQSIKDHGEQREFSVFIKESRWNRLFYDVALGQWAERFGAENLHVYSYDLAKQGQSVTRVLLDLLLNNRRPEFLFEDRFSNSSLPAICYEAAKYLNRANMPKSERIALLTALRRGLKNSRAAQNPLLLSMLQREYLNPSMSQAISDVFGSSNQRTAAEYFDGANPFPGMSPAATETAGRFDGILQNGTEFAPKDVIAIISHALLANKAVGRNRKALADSL